MIKTPSMVKSQLAMKKSFIPIWVISSLYAARVLLQMLQLNFHNVTSFFNLDTRLTENLALSWSIQVAARTSSLQMLLVNSN